MATARRSTRELRLTVTADQNKTGPAVQTNKGICGTRQRHENVGDVVRLCTQLVVDILELYSGDDLAASAELVRRILSSEKQEVANSAAGVHLALQINGIMVSLCNHAWIAID